MDESVKIRAFLALPLAPYFQSRVQPLVTRLKQEYPWVRWVQPSEIHITLHFFGSIERREVDRISKIVTPLASQTKPLEVFLEGLGVFPNFQRPRVVWVGLKGEVDALRRLQGQLEEGFRKAGFPCEEREFKPHLTVGRVKGGKRGEGIPKLDFAPTPSERVKELVLFQSHLTPQGAIYGAIETYPLSAS